MNNELKIYITDVIIILCIMIGIFILSYAQFGMFFVDSSREAYIPMAMNRGSVLYKDILNVYQPLGYQINAVLYLLFGENLRTLYFAGLVNAVLIVLGCYALCRILFEKNRYTPLLISLFIIVCSVYAVNLNNYIFPYSYSMVYALNTFIWSLCFLLEYLKSEKNIFLVLSFLFFGTCCALKYEFILFCLVLFYVLFFKNSKNKLLCLGALVFVPFLSSMILIIQGCSFNDLLLSLKFIIKLSGTESLKACYRTLGIIPSFVSLKQFVVSFFETISFSVVFVFISSKLFEKITNKIILYGSLSIIILALSFFLFPMFVEANSYFFCWVGVFDICILIFLLFKNKQEVNRLFLICLISALLVSVKSIFMISANNYGNFFFPLLFICLIYFVLDLFSNRIEKPINLFLVFLIFIYGCSNFERRHFAYPSLVKTEKGVICTTESAASSINQLLGYISSNTKPSDTLLVIPEGAMINFLSNRLSNNRYFYLIPPNIETFGEEKIFSDIENSLPDYIIIQPMSYLNFNETFFCESFGRKICGLIPKYYKPPIVFGNQFQLALYERNSLGCDRDGYCPEETTSKGLH